MASKTRRILSVAAFPILIASIVALAFVFRKPLWNLFSSPQAVRDAVSSWGLAAPLVFIGAQIFQVVVFIVPGETVQIAAGYLFGFAPGLALTVVGIAAGSALNYLVGLWLGRPFLAQIVAEDQLHKAERIAANPRAQMGFFLLFVIPGLPKDILCYVAGLSQLRFLPFLAISMIGRLPGIAGSALMGSAAADKKWVLAISVFTAACVLFLLGLAFRESIQKWIDTFTRRS